MNIAEKSTGCLTAVLPELHGLDLSETTQKIILVQITYSSQKATAPIWTYGKANHIPMAHF